MWPSALRIFHRAGHLVLAGCVAIGVVYPGSDAKGSDAERSDSADSLTLKTVISEVVRGNARVIAVGAMEQAARQRAAASGGWDDPMLMAGITNLPTSLDLRADPMTMTMIGIGQRIPYAGDRGLTARAAVAEADAVGQDRRGVLLDLVTEAKRAFYDVYYGQQIQQARSAQESLLTDVLAAVQARVRAGLAGAEEAAAAEADLGRARVDMLMASQMVDAAWQTLNSLRGRSAADPIPPLAAPVLPVWPDSEAVLWEAARRNYPPLQRAQHEADRYGLLAAAAGRMRWPMLDLSSTYGIRRDTPAEEREDMLGVQATISLPLFSRRRQGHMAESMEAMRRQALADGQQLERDVQATLAQLHTRAARWREGSRLYREQILPAAELAYRSSLSAYVVNRMTLRDVLGYAAVLYGDRIAAIENARALAQTAAEIERYTTDAGTLLPATDNRGL